MILIAMHTFIGVWTYIKMFKGRPEDLNWVANLVTDSIELRSNSMVSILALGFSLTSLS